MLHPLVEAIEQWHWGRRPDEVALAADHLRSIAPDHWVLRELSDKLAVLRHEADAPPREARPDPR